MDDWAGRENVEIRRMESHLIQIYHIILTNTQGVFGGEKEKRERNKKQNKKTGFQVRLSPAVDFVCKFYL